MHDSSRRLLVVVVMTGLDIVADHYTDDDAYDGKTDEDNDEADPTHAAGSACVHYRLLGLLQTRET